MRAALYVDGEYLRTEARFRGREWGMDRGRVDYGKLVAVAKTRLRLRFDLRRVFVSSSSPAFEDVLRSFGFEVHPVNPNGYSERHNDALAVMTMCGTVIADLAPTRVVMDYNLDGIEGTVDHTVPPVDHVVLVTGNGLALPVVSVMKERGLARVSLFAFGASCASDLRDAVDDFEELGPDVLYDER